MQKNNSSLRRQLIRGFVVFFSLLLAVSGIVAIREYLLLKNIEQVLLTSAPPLTAEKSNTRPITESQKTRIVTGVARRDAGSRIVARVNFVAFKKTVEKNPAVLSTWGSLRWKVLEDIPALCIRNLGADTPLTPLGVQSGDCITHLDGETVNQPMRNLGIWLTLGSRASLTIETLRGTQKISYILTKN